VDFGNDHSLNKASLSPPSPNQPQTNKTGHQVEPSCIHDNTGTNGLDTDKASPMKWSKVEPSRITPSVKHNSMVDSGYNFLLSKASPSQTKQSKVGSSKITPPVEHDLPVN